MVVVVDSPRRTLACLDEHGHNLPPCFSQDRQGPTQDKPAEEIGVLMSDVQAEKVEWLWEGRIPLGKLTILDGDPGVGKSVITMDDVAASVTTGRTFPNGEHLEHVGYVGGVVILSAEDGLADTIRPRGGRWRARTLAA